MEKIRCPIDNHKCNLDECAKDPDCRRAINDAMSVRNLGQFATGLVEGDQDFAEENRKSFVYNIAQIADKYKLDIVKLSLYVNKLSRKD